MTDSSQVPGLLERLDKEILNGATCVDGFIDDLQMFQNRRGSSQLDGVEAKLQAAERDDQMESAQVTKELFAKLLAKMQHYPSAQKLFALFLARINDVFEHHIVPHASSFDRQEIDKIIEERIVQPTLKDMGLGFGHFTINHAHIRGMIYWLADRCYIRWR